MFLKLLKATLMLAAASSIPFASYASSLEEFFAMQGGRKITNNPASAADLQGGLIDANLFTFGEACTGSFDKTSGIKSHKNSCNSPTTSSSGFGTNTGLLGVNYAADGSGRDAFVDMAADFTAHSSGSAITDIQYKSRDSRSTSVTLGYGWDYLAFATTADWNYEWYSDGAFVEGSTTYAGEGSTRYKTESIYKTGTSNLFALALPPISGLGPVSVGVRNNSATRYHEYDPYGTHPTLAGNYKMSGKGTEHSQDYGILIPDINGTFGVGYVQRNFSNKTDQDFKMAYDYVSTADNTTVLTYRTLAYSTDPFVGYGLSWKFKMFALPTMLLFDSGQDDSKSESAMGFNVNYQGTHISYGRRDTIYSAFKLQKETAEVKFSWAQLKVISYTFFIKSGDNYEEVGKINIPTVSISLYFDSGGFRRPIDKYCNTASQAECYN